MDAPFATLSCINHRQQSNPVYPVHRCKFPAFIRYSPYSPTIAMPDTTSTDTFNQSIAALFDESATLTTALTHSSYINEHAENGAEDNERLEFLGDAVLDMAIAEALYARFPEQQEGALTSMRSNIVKDATLAAAARRLEIGQSLLMGAGELANGGRSRDSNLAGAFEAIVGAIFLDMGYDAARDFCVNALKAEIANATPHSQHPKSALQELAQGKGLGAPKYHITGETGQDHAPTFNAEVLVAGIAMGTGSGRSKSLAEQEAAKNALTTLMKTG